MQYYNFFLAWWFNVGVQIFFIVSGYLYAKKDIESPIKWLGKQFKKILIPYYIFILLAIISYHIIGNDIPFSDIVNSFFCIGTIKGIGHLWFIRYILFCYLITIILCRIKKYILNKPFLHGIVYISIFMLVYIALSIPIYTFINPIWICCYIVGYFYSFYAGLIKYGIFRRLNIFLVFVGLIMNIIRIYLRYFSESIYLNNHLQIFYDNISHLMLGLSLFIIFSFVFKNIGKNKLLSFSDNNSYYIYIVHQLFILSPLTVMNITDCIYLNWLLAVFLILISGVLLKKITAIWNGKI